MSKTALKSLRSMVSARCAIKLQLLKRYERIAIDLKRSDLLGGFYTQLGNCEWSFGNFDSAIKTLIKAVETCDPVKDARYIADAYVNLEFCFYFTGEYEQLFDIEKEALDLLKQEFNLRHYVYALTSASWAYTYVGCWNAAITEGHKALKTAKEYSSNSLISFASLALSNVYFFKLDLPRAIEYGTYAVDKAPTPADKDKTWAQLCLAMAWCRSGELNKGMQVLTSLIETFQAASWMPGVVFCKAFLGEG